MFGKTIISLDEFKKLNSSLELTDNEIQVFLKVVTDYIHTLAGISLEEGKHTEYLYGNGTRRLYLIKRPIKEIIKILRNGNESNINDYVIENECIRLKRGIFFQGQDINEPYLAGKYTKSEYIEVTYIGGFKYPDEHEEGNVPWDLKMAIVNIISDIVLDNSEQGKLKSYSIADISYSFKTKAERSEVFIEMLRGYISW